MQNQALLESVSEIVTLAGDGIRAALADLNEQSDDADYGAALDTCQGSVETIAMAAAMVELDSLQQVCDALTEHIGALNGDGYEFLKNYGQRLADWSSIVLAYIQQPSGDALNADLLAPLPDELRVRFLPEAGVAEGTVGAAADADGIDAPEATKSAAPDAGEAQLANEPWAQQALPEDSPTMDIAVAANTADKLTDVADEAPLADAILLDDMLEQTETEVLAPEALEDPTENLAVAQPAAVLAITEAPAATEAPAVDATVEDSDHDSGAVNDFVAADLMEEVTEDTCTESAWTMAEAAPDDAQAESACAAVAESAVAAEVVAKEAASAVASAIFAEAVASELDAAEAASADASASAEVVACAEPAVVEPEAEIEEQALFTEAAAEPETDSSVADDDENFASALQAQLAATFDELEPFRQQLATASDAAELGIASAGYGEVVERIQVAAEAVGLTGFGVLGEVINHNVHAILAMDAAARAEVGETLAEWPALALTYFDDPEEEAAQIALVELLSRPIWPLPMPEEQHADLLIALSPDPDEYLADDEPRPTVATPDDVVLAVGEDVSPKLVEVFMQESPVNAADFSAAVERIIRGEDIVKSLGSAQRLAHNIKGSANMIGAKGIANMTHHVEDILEYLTEHQQAPQPALANTLQEAADCVEVMLESLHRGEQAPVESRRILQDVLNWANRMDVGQLETPVEAATAVAAPVEEAARVIEAPLTAPPVAPQSAAEPAAAATPATVDKVIRVPTETIDAMFRMVGEVSIALDQLQERFEVVRRNSNEVRSQDDVVQQRRFELENFIDVRHVANTQQRVRQLSRGQHFDPLEMDQYDELYSTTRSFIESVVDSRRMTQQMRGEFTSLERALAPLQRMRDDLQLAVMKTRMEPVNTIIARLQRSVRQAARATDKQVDLVVEGSDIQLDSEVLDKLAEPLMHVLRNAVDHGIEAPDKRVAKGKPETGVIELRFFQEGQNVVVRCVDDGAGLDYQRIRATAVEKGTLPRGANISNEELARMIMAPGFSTRTSATQLSGRGVGMDVVQTTVRDLKGVMEIGDAKAGGCQISLRLPITLLTSHSLVVRAGQERYAIPTSSIMQVMSPRLGRFTEVGNQLAYEIGREAYPATTLRVCLGYSRDAGLPAEDSSVVLIYSDIGPVAVAIDQLMNSYDLVVKSLGRYVGDVRGVAGLSSLADGSLIPVLDVAELLRSPVQASVSMTASADATRVAAARPQAAATILIVDDSISVRQTLSDLVKDAGYEVLIARDGLEAIDVLRKQTPDLVLSDIEMPRMNGLELVSYIRTSHSADLPIIMITSRTMQKHREQAAEAGANSYVTKPFDEDELLASIRSYIQ